jgi:hypothetical protein
MRNKQFRIKFHLEVTEMLHAQYKRIFCIYLEYNFITFFLRKEDAHLKCVELRNDVIIHGL